MLQPFLIEIFMAKSWKCLLFFLLLVASLARCVIEDERKGEEDDGNDEAEHYFVIETKLKMLSFPSCQVLLQYLLYYFLMCCLIVLMKYYQIPARNIPLKLFSSTNEPLDNQTSNQGFQGVLKTVLERPSSCQIFDKSN